MKASLTMRVWRAFREAFGHILRAAALGLVIGFVLGEVLAAILNKTAGDPTGLTLTWPPVISFAPVTAFVHVMAILFALALAYAVGLTVAVNETIRGAVYAAEHVDDAIGAVAHEGVNVADAVVDALDGPNRHGFTGQRDPAHSAKS